MSQTRLIPISINGNVLDPNTPSFRGTNGFGVGDSVGSNYILVQTSDHLSKKNKEELKEKEVEIEELVSDKTYLCRFNPDSLDKVRKLAFVEWASVYGTNFVVDPALKQTSTAAELGHQHKHQQHCLLVARRTKSMLSSTRTME